MHIFTDIDTHLPSPEHPIALTIGNFDGIHLGHQAVLKSLAETGAKQLVVISYSNHPSEVLSSRRPTPLICSFEHKKKLLAKMGIYALYSIPFTQEFAKQSPSEFLERIRKAIPFDFLVLGEDARLGKDREGTPEVIQALGKKMGFESRYVEDLIVDGERLSSTRIRQLIQQGNVKKISEYLGRPYSILWGDTDRLCLPPRNYYPCQFSTVRATAKISHSGIEVNPQPSQGIEVKFLS
jgi:riboflavin kinase/FMN adenylyltransferase